MPFGVMNGPVIFTIFINDMDSEWKALAQKNGINIGPDNNTVIIIDDIKSHAMDYDSAFTYMECQLMVCKMRRLSLSLPKSIFFPKRFEFVGVDIAAEGNYPAKSKHDLI